MIVMLMIYLKIKMSGENCLYRPHGMLGMNIILANGTIISTKLGKR